MFYFKPIASCPIYTQKKIQYMETQNFTLRRERIPLPYIYFFLSVVCIVCYLDRPCYSLLTISHILLPMICNTFEA